MNPIETRIKQKIERLGTPLKEWDIQIYRGVLTGFNEAFIINKAKRDELVANSAKNAQIIRPILRGRDLGRYRTDFQDNYLIYIPWHFPLHQDQTIKGVSEKAEKLFEQEYPAIYQHLLQYKTELSNRNQAETGIRYEWYALQRYGANYYQDFDKEKIMYPDICTESRFSWGSKQEYVNNTIYFMVGKDCTKYLLGLMNSKLIWFLISNNVTGLGEKGYRLFGQFMVEMRLKKEYNTVISNRIELLVNEILDNPNSNILENESEINHLVYQLYELTSEEIQYIEQK